VAIDPRQLRPGELCRLLNSTPLGEVINAQRLRRQRERAGLRIVNQSGDGKTIDLVRYVAWLAHGRHERLSRSGPPSNDAYEGKKNQALARERRISENARDIGELPDIVDEARRAAGLASLRTFFETYFPSVFDLAWSPDHLRVIAKIEQAVVDGELFAMAMPRGFGKTSLSAMASIWAAFSGRHEYIVMVGADQSSAQDELLGAVKIEIQYNDLLLDDFPEVCYPVRKLEGITQRAAGQLYRGVPTNIRWAEDKIVLPTIPGSAASGVVIQPAGLTGRIRGMKHARTDGRHVRPSLVLIDDPQTDESARSLSQCETRERLLAGAILGLAGPGKRIAGLMSLTVIAPGDMADRILDRDRHPEWQGERTRMLYQLPEATDLWDRYADLLREGSRAGRGMSEATEFYRAHREEMDKGAEAAWEACYRDTEISAIQHAMNRKIRDEPSFWSECQNAPLSPDESDDPIMSETEIRDKINRIDRGVVPARATRLTAFVDIQAKLLFWCVIAWDDEFTGWIVDYHTEPEQRVGHFSLSSAQRTLQRVARGVGREGAIRAGLDRIDESVLMREWAREDGSTMRIDQALVDAGWGESTDIVHDWCAVTKSPTLAAFGRGVGASHLPMSDWSRKPGEKIGLNWRMRISHQRKRKYVLHDVNYWKSFVHSRLRTSLGDPGSLSLFGDSPGAHALFAEHMTAEFRVRTTAQGRQVDEWKLRNRNRDNHWFDCVVGAAVAASIDGSELAGVAPPKRKKRKRISLSEIQAGRR